MQIHFIVHEVFEAPGAYLHWAQARGYGISWSRVYAGTGYRKTPTLLICWLCSAVRSRRARHYLSAPGLIATPSSV